MIWFLIFVALSIPVVWAMRKLDKDVANNSDLRFAGVMFWPLYQIIVSTYRLGRMWDSIYFKMFPEDKENTG